MQILEESKLLLIINDFLTDARLYLILGLIFLDVVFGVAEAIKSKHFDLAKLADFYRAKVVPMLIGYAALYLAFNYATGIRTVLSEALVTTAWGALVAALVGGILENLRLIYGNEAASQ